MISAADFRALNLAHYTVVLAIFGAIATLPWAGSADTSSPEDHSSGTAPFTIATDRPGSTHAQIGEILCHVYNRDRADGAPLCKSKYIPGGSRQLVELKAGRAQMAIMQSDVMAAAVKGEKKFKPNKSLRVLLPLYEQVLAVVVRDVTRTMKVNMASLSSSRIAIPETVRNGRFTLTSLFEQLAPKLVNTPRFRLLTLPEQMDALCNDRIDIAFAVLGHPNGAIQQGIHDCQISLVPFDFTELRAVVEKSMHWHMGRIPEDTYAGQAKAVASPAVTALLITTKEFNRRTAESFVRVLRKNQHTLRRLHRSLFELDLDRRPAAYRHLKLFGLD